MVMPRPSAIRSIVAQVGLDVGVSILCKEAGSFPMALASARSETPFVSLASLILCPIVMVYLLCKPLYQRSAFMSRINLVSIFFLTKLCIVDIYINTV